MVYCILFLKYFSYIFLGGLAFYSVVTKYFRLDDENKKMYFLYSFGMGPAMASLILYYLYLLIPKQENIFYLGTILGVFILMILLNRQAIGHYLSYFKKAFISLSRIFYLTPLLKKYLFGLNGAIVVYFFFLAWFEWNYGYRFYLNLLYAGMGGVFLISLIVSTKIRGWFIKNVRIWVRFFGDIFTLKFRRENHSFFNEIYNYFSTGNNFYFFSMGLLFVFGLKIFLLTFSMGHDFLEYMVQADFIFKNKEIVYTSHIFYPENGFYYVGLHGWSFPLQYSLERLIDSFTSYGYGLYFKGLTLWYGLVIISVVYFKVKKEISVLYAAVSVVILLGAKGFLSAITYSHIDSYRIFFFTLSFLFTIQLINNSRTREIPLLAFVAGTSAFAHSLGVIVAVVLGMAILIYVQKNWLGKVKDTVYFALLTLIFGGFHYVVDVFYGTGWIFKEIDFY